MFDKVAPNIKEEKVEEKRNFQSSSGGIPMDSLPLNWGKQKNISKILEILRKCHGPYGFNNQLQDLSTIEIFKEVYKIA